MVRHERAEAHGCREDHRVECRGLIGFVVELARHQVTQARHSQAAPRRNAPQVKLTRRRWSKFAMGCVTAALLHGRLPWRVGLGYSFYICNGKKNSLETRL